NFGSLEPKAGSESSQQNHNMRIFDAKKFLTIAPFERSFHGEAKVDWRWDLRLKFILPFFLYPVLPSG
ncbi:MAG: hypothetical protein ACPF9G_08135, partial [Paracoccaceae bacterium]